MASPSLLRLQFQKRGFTTKNSGSMERKHNSRLHSTKIYHLQQHRMKMLHRLALATVLSRHSAAAFLRTNTIPSSSATALRLSRLYATTQSLPAMEKLQSIDELSVTVIVDNESDTMSTTGINSRVEGFQYLPQRKQQQQDGTLLPLCSASHGFSLLLKARSGDKVQTILMDAGPSPDLWKTNMQSLQIDPTTIDAIVLSHYHWDHSGGLRGAVPLAASKSDHHPVVDLHSDAVVSRGRPLPDDKKGVKPHYPDNPTASELESLGARVELSDQEHSILGQDLFYVSGYIPRLNDFETGIPGHLTLRKDGQWKPDTDIREERYVACRVKNRGLGVLSACSHAGINNVCRDALHKAGSNEERLFAVMGGFHLGGAKVQDRISQTVRELKELEPSIVLAGHCTGWKAKAQLAMEFEGNYQPLSVGCTYKFTSE